jgi:tyrosinase
VGADTPLTPFHRNAQGEFWTSNLVRDITKLGYTYPELVGNPSNETLVANIKALYDDGAVSRLEGLSKRQENGEKTSRDWNVHVELVPGYTTSVFLGGDAGYVGSFSTLFQKGMGKADLPFNGLISLSSGIASAIEGGSLAGPTEDEVVEFLKKDLQLKVTDATGAEVAQADVPKFKIEVFSQLETVPQSDGEFPSVISTDKYPDVISA